MRMPVMNGYELAEWMRGNAQTRSGPIIFITGESDAFRPYFYRLEAGAVALAGGGQPLARVIERANGALFEAMRIGRARTVISPGPL